MRLWLWLGTKPIKSNFNTANMKPFDGRIGKRLSRQMVGDLRFFAYYIGNETLLAGTDWGVHYNIEVIFEPSEAIGDIFALELFRNTSMDGQRQNNGPQLDTTLSSTQLIGRYIQSLNDQTPFPIALESLRSPNSNNWRDVVVRFFRDLGLRTLKTEPLADCSDDYAWCILTEGNYLERVAAIFCNVLRLDADFNAINEAWARHRSSQYIRLVNDETDTYRVQPRFKDWETMLWM